MLRTRAIAVRQPERKEVPAEVQFEVAPAQPQTKPKVAKFRKVTKSDKSD